MRRVAAIIGVVLATTTACRVKVPDASEQSELLNRRIIRAAPNWFAPATTGGAPTQSGGFISDTLTPMPSVQPRQEEMVYPLLVRREEIREEKKEESKPIKNPSALNRVNEQCPGHEVEINAALVNTDREERLNQYKVLTQKCPMSADLFLWLAQDYAKSGKLIDARGAYEHVLVLDPNNEEAKARISEVDQELSK